MEEIKAPNFKEERMHVGGGMEEQGLEKGS